MLVAQLLTSEHFWYFDTKNPVPNLETGLFFVKSLPRLPHRKIIEF